MKIKRLEFVLTEKCNSRCIHCQGGSSPEREGVMEVEDGLTYLEEVTSVTELDSFMIFGGESMLYPQRTIKLFQRARELGIPRIELITNGFWGKDVDRARTLAIQLKMAGVNEMLISVDAFHSPHILLEYPRNAGSASLSAGIERVAWNVAVLEDINSMNEFDRKTREILDTLAPLGLEVHFNKVWPQGRARRNLRKFFSRQPLEGDCPEKENALINLTCITLDPAGWASTCWNLAVGNAKKVPLSEILTGYDWKKHPIICIMVKKGPMGLINLPESKHFNFQKGEYIDKCHLCGDLRKFMRKKYPEMYV